jgi:hypothetical protein
MVLRGRKGEATVPNRGDIANIERLANELHDKGVLNLDTPVRSLIEPEGIGIVDPGTQISGHVLAVTRYVLVVALQGGSRVNEVMAVADAVRGEVNRPQ